MHMLINSQENASWNYNEITLHVSEIGKKKFNNVRCWTEYLNRHINGTVTL